MVTISMKVEATFLEWDDFNEVVAFLNDNHNTAINFIFESNAQDCEVTNVEVINERAD